MRAVDIEIIVFELLVALPAINEPRKENPDILPGAALGVDQEVAFRTADLVDEP